MSEANSVVHSIGGASAEISTENDNMKMRYSTDNL